MLREQLLPLAEKILPQAIRWRRQLHAYPELAYEEHQTAALIAEVLRGLGMEVSTGIAKTGVVGILRGHDPERHCVGLRADMDALPIQEANKTDYASQLPGKMHACGHDFHTANLLAVAHVLHELRESWSGSIKFIFQPSEEKMPSGAAAMIAAGVLQEPRVDALFGLHVHPELPAGNIGFRAGKFMASADEIHINIIGRGGHAAQPSAFVSPLLMGSEIIRALQVKTDLSVPVVLSFGRFMAEGATNVIPERAVLAGTLRCFDETVRAEMHQMIAATCSNVAHQFGGQCELHLEKGYPVLVNNETLTSQASHISRQLFGAEQVHDLPIRMGAEDFAYYSHVVPACFFRVGTGNPAKGITSAIHTPTFDIDEYAFLVSIAAMAGFAMAFRK
ncbi:MAG: M20 family metallopeptidase [Chitinophagales bacterium]